MGCKLCFNDGVNVRLIKTEALPKAYQLAIAFEDGEALVFTVAMYGGIILHRGEYDNEYYQKSGRHCRHFPENSVPIMIKGWLKASRH